MLVSGRVSLQKKKCCFWNFNLLPLQKYTSPNGIPQKTTWHSQRPRPLRLGYRPSSHPFGRPIWVHFGWSLSRHLPSGKYHQNGGFSMAMLVYRRVPWDLGSTNFPTYHERNVNPERHLIWILDQQFSGWWLNQPIKNWRPKLRSSYDRYSGAQGSVQWIMLEIS